MVTRAELEAYLGRDWHRARVQKDRDILAINVARGWAYSLEVVEQLNALARENGYEETEEERREDFEALVALKAKIDAIDRKRGEGPDHPAARALAGQAALVRVRGSSAGRPRSASRHPGSRSHR